MVSFSDLSARWRFWVGADRLGPDIPATAWRLHFPSTSRRLCERKFRRFGPDADFRWGAYAVACSKISIGERVVIRPGVMLFAYPHGEDGQIIIEDDVLIGSGVHMYSANHAFSDPARSIIDQGHEPAADVTLRRGAWIGANAILLPGVEIGQGAVVGAGSVVTRSIPAGMIAVGNPARPVRARGDRKSPSRDAAQS
jgi:acetyltransferase-like isoleucine patch superfamily enzyme